MDCNDCGGLINTWKGIRWNRDVDLQILADSLASINKKLTQPSVTSLAESPTEISSGQSTEENQDPLSLVDQLERLAQLYSDGLLSEEEFQAAKQGILND